MNSAGSGVLSPASVLMLAAIEPSAPRNLELLSRSATSLKIRGLDERTMVRTHAMRFNIAVPLSDGSYQHKLYTTNKHGVHTMHI